MLNTDCPYCGGHKVVYPMKDGKVDYEHIIPCHCSVKEILENKKKVLLRSCEFPPMVEDMTFKNFKVYSEVKIAYELAKETADNPGKLTWLSLLGENGVGKTHLGVAICKAWANAGIPARYVFVPLLLDELREGFTRNNGEEYHTRFNYYCTVSLLFLDDLGAESKTAWVQEKLETIVDYRLMHKLSLIVTSNKQLDELSPRIASRLTRASDSKIVAICASDYVSSRKKQ